MWLFETVFFFRLADKKWSLATLDRWLSYAVTIVLELAWVDSALVNLDEWLSYIGGPISRFDCTNVHCFTHAV